MRAGARAPALTLGNDLAVPVGEVDMLRNEPSLPPAMVASLATIAAFQQVLRVTITETPVGPALDLDRSTRRDSPSP